MECKTTSLKTMIVYIVKKEITVFINVLEHLANSVDFYEVNLTESLQNSSKMT